MSFIVSAHLVAAYSATLFKSCTCTFGMIIVYGAVNGITCEILYSASLNESVHTNTNFRQSSYCFVLIITQVNTGEKFFSITAYSTLLIHLVKEEISNVNSRSDFTEGTATNSVAAIHLMINSSFAEVIVKLSFTISILNTS
jgi:hypothetical protein